MKKILLISGSNRNGNTNYLSVKTNTTSIVIKH